MPSFQSHDNPSPSTVRAARAGYLLAFYLGPVQSYITAARTVRDLWSGSALLSWLTCQAMQPILKMPEAAIVQPYREWTDPSFQGMPNRFLAELPESVDPQEVASACEAAVRGAWEALAAEVHAWISKQVPGGQWDAGWKEQLRDFLEIRVAWVPLSADPQTWGDRVQSVMQALEAQRQIAHWPGQGMEGGNRAKCTLLGSYERMGPVDTEQGKQFWEQLARHDWNGVRVRQGEALCAVSLLKRFAVPAVLGAEPSINKRDLRFPDTATIAATKWLELAKLDPGRIRRDYASWSGQWLHWQTPNDDKDDPCPVQVWEEILRARKEHGAAPAYFAILKADGDKLGKRLQDSLKTGRASLRDVTLQVGTFMQGVAAIVDEHNGFLIYAGGDDLLALLPADEALGCAQVLRSSFQEIVGGDLSAGVAIVHYKEDLRESLNLSSAALERAKTEGRNACGLTAARRSGEVSTVVASWEILQQIQVLVHRFSKGVDESDRWIYQLRNEVTTLSGQEEKAQDAEVKRLSARSRDAATRSGRSADNAESALALLNQIRQRHASRPARSQQADPDTKSGALEEFIACLLSASFIARTGAPQ
ncbi:MAG: hypothetical protein GEEBNDBF_02718 [bacterium]|nr:hypothetical protein [bacterium]